jgi:hypothetical protein
VTTPPTRRAGSYGALAFALCCVRSRTTRGEVGMNNTVSLVIAVLVIILLIVLILQFV